MPNPTKRSIGRTTTATSRLKRYRTRNLCVDGSVADVGSNDNISSVDEIINAVAVGFDNVEESVGTSMSAVKVLPVAFDYNVHDAEKYKKFVDIGTLLQTCDYCQALKWKDETVAFCCSNGNVRLPSLPKIPALLSDLLEMRHQRSNVFLSHIRKYNTAFAMTSMGCNEIKTEGVFSFTFKICGRLYHRIGSLMPAPSQNHQYLQIYFLEDDNKQLDIRMQYEFLNDLQLTNSLQTMLIEHNVYIKEFKTVYRRIQEMEHEISDVRIVLKDKRIDGIHRGRLNLPTCNEIAVVLVGDYTAPRDIVIESNSGEFKHICETHRSYDPLQYPILFPYGTDGYSIDLKQINGKSSLTALQFYKYRLMIRDTNYLLMCKELLNIFIVDMFVKIEAERALYIKLHQSNLRSEEYNTLRDAITNDGDITEMGKLVVLPSSFTGSPRYYHEKMQDGMAYIRKYGTADFFVTMTCNPRWKEIQEALLPGQQTIYRHDIVARVFHLKVKRLMDLITKKYIFGSVKCYMYSIEWQKRGLPHVHVIIWLHDRMTADKIDSVISAEIPDPNVYPELHKLVKTHMIHGPCGSRNYNCVCMANGKCTKRYPKPFVIETCTKEDGYPLYRRRLPSNGGFTARINERIGDVDNQWVVPYNPFLLHVLDAHINVEACHSVQAIKYLCKYVVKGNDFTTVELKKNGSIDEVSYYLNGRYVSTNEAIWRIFGFHIHDHYPSILHLSVHLENGQRVYFDEHTSPSQLTVAPKTTLTEFFLLCRTDPLAKTLLYDEVAQYFLWSNKKYHKRKRGTRVPGYLTYFRTDTIGRIYTIHPNQQECYYLRLLLSIVRGPTSFEYLRTYEGIVYNTFHETCLARGLLENDSQWANSMADGVLTQTGEQLRHLFVLLLIYCDVSDPLCLYNEFREALADDIRYKMQQSEDELVDFSDIIYQKSLQCIDEGIRSYDTGKSALTFNLPLTAACNIDLDTPEIRRELSYNIRSLEDVVATNTPKLNDEQSTVYNIVIRAIKEQQGSIMFLDAPGGTGKTFLMNHILATIRSDMKIAIALASSGIAATLLSGGRTVHSGLKVPIDINSASTCSITKQSGLAKLLQQCTLLIWDECSMSHKYVVEAVDRTLKFIRDNDKPMGGMVVLFTGDFRQTLPVVKRGTRADIVNASLKYSLLWKDVKLLPPLKTNMRLTTTNVEYAKILLSIGNGTFPHEGMVISYSTFAKSVLSVDELVSIVWPGVKNIGNKSREWISERTILAPLNASVDNINNVVLSSITSQGKIYYSIDKAVNIDEEVNFPVEFLNSVNLPGMPSHILELKIGVPIMLMRNLRPPTLCNGTRLVVTRLMDHLVEAVILTGCGKGDTVCIPRIPILSSDCPFSFKRIQFPIRVCFAITINKAQGQSFNYVGLDLTESCFSHGQLYVACSRTTNPDNLYILGCNNKTHNVVYEEVFL